MPEAQDVDWQVARFSLTPAISPNFSVPRAGGKSSPAKALYAFSTGAIQW
jgi:hypothetical protein